MLKKNRVHVKKTEESWGSQVKLQFNLWFMANLEPKGAHLKLLLQFKLPVMKQRQFGPESSSGCSGGTSAPKEPPLRGNRSLADSTLHGRGGSVRYWESKAHFNCSEQKPKQWCPSTHSTAACGAPHSQMFFLPCHVSFCFPAMFSIKASGALRQGGLVWQNSPSKGSTCCKAIQKQSEAAYLESQSPEET